MKYYRVESGTRRMTIPACANCGKRPGTETWLGDAGVLGYVHGMGVLWCELCVATAQLEYALALAKWIPALEQKVRDLGGEP